MLKSLVIIVYVVLCTACESGADVRLLKNQILIIFEVELECVDFFLTFNPGGLKLICVCAIITVNI